MDKVVVTTRTMHDDLLKVCVGRLGELAAHHIAMRGMEPLYYLTYILGLDADWVVNIDEDAFVVSEQSLLDLLSFMQDNNLDFCGMPDGGAISMRTHNPASMNAFFNIFHTSVIRSRIAEFVPEEHNADNSDRVQFQFRSIYAYDNYEPYYPIFFWLHKSGFRPFYLLNILQDSDGITTLVGNHKADLMLKHTWFARDYKIDDYQTTRIQRVIDAL